MPPKNLSGRIISESNITIHGIPHRQIIYEGGRTYLEPLTKPRVGLEARQARREYGRLRREKGG